MTDLNVSTKATWQDDDLDYSIDIFVEIENGIVTAECDVEDYHRAKLQRMLLRAIDTAQAIVDLAAFTIGGHFLVHFEAFLESDGTIGPLNVGDPDLAALCTTVSIGSQSFADTLQILTQERSLIPALRDLIEATSFPRKVVPHCAKAVETLRNMFVPGAENRKVGWIALQEALQVTESYLKLIRDASVAPRHGDHQAISADTTDEIARRAWTLMNRFLEFKKRGSKPLPPSEFPTLTG